MIIEFLLLYVKQTKKLKGFYFLDVEKNSKIHSKNYSNHYQVQKSKVINERMDVVVCKALQNCFLKSRMTLLVTCKSGKIKEEKKEDDEEYEEAFLTSKDINDISFAKIHVNMNTNPYLNLLK